MFIEIPGYKDYFINEKGKVYSRKSNKLLAVFNNTTGYPCVKLYSRGIQKNLLIHRLLAFIFKDLPSLDSDLEVDHVDTNIQNFDLNNLQVLDAQSHLSKTLKDKGHTPSSHRVCNICGVRISKTASICYKCNIPSLSIEITVEDIEYWVTNFSWVRASKELGLSDNGLRKRYAKLTGKDPKTLKKRK